MHPSKCLIYKCLSSMLEGMRRGLFCHGPVVMLPKYRYESYRADKSEATILTCTATSRGNALAAPLRPWVAWA